MMMVTELTLLLAALAAVCQAGLLREVSIGSCPDIANKVDLEIEPYLGSWYEIERFEIIWEEGMDCVQAIYSDLGDGVVEVRNTARTAEGAATEIIATATVLEPGVLLVDFPDQPLTEYHVLDTDYVNFSAVYNCDQVEDLRFQYAWVLSRTPTLDQATYEQARQVFANNGIDVTHFNPTYQGSDCPYIRKGFPLP